MNHIFITFNGVVYRDPDNGVLYTIEDEDKLVTLDGRRYILLANRRSFQRMFPDYDKPRLRGSRR